MTTEQPNIIRSPHAKERPYFCMSRKTAQDNRLSLEARGILAYLLSKPDDWEIMKSDLMTAGNCGRDKINSIIKELIKFGYLIVEYPHVTEDGPKKGQFLPAFYRLHEEPFTENPLTPEASTPNQHLDSTEETHSTDSTEKPLCATQRTRKKSGKKVIPAEKMNPMKDEIAAVFEWDWDTMTADERGVIQRTAHSLCSSNVDPSEVIHIYRFCQGHYDTFGPNALATNLSKSRKARGANGTPPAPSTPPPPHEDLCADPLAYVGTRGVING